MILGSPAANLGSRLVFGAEEEDNGTSGELLDEEFADSHGKSMYVALFEDMLKTVLFYERHLFSNEEITCFQKYARLSYNARYLLIRLCLRKTDKWHRRSMLKYTSELGDTIPDAIRELCRSAAVESPAETVKVKAEVIDLTLDEVVPPVAGPSKQQLPTDTPNSITMLADGIFADDESQATLPELLDCLKTEELRDISKQMKLKTVGNRSKLVEQLLSYSSSQATINFPKVPPPVSLSKRKAKPDSKRTIQLQLSFAPLKTPQGKMKTQQDRLRQMAMKALGQCIRVNEDVFRLFRRLNVVYFRSTQYSAAILTPSILSRAQKRTYSSYECVRTPHVWQSRNALIAYEEALEIEAQVDGILGGSNGQQRARSRSVASRTPAPTGQPATPSPKKRGEDNSYSPYKLAANKSRANDLNLEDAVPESPRIQDAMEVKSILESVYPRWQDLVRTKSDDDERAGALQRFDCAHVLTRVVCKGAHALGVLKEYDRELEVLTALLAQTRWRRGRRGRWHDRRAMILMTHMEKDEETSLAALEAVKEGLMDDDTHIIFRPMLERRLTRLEKRLKIPEDERHVCQSVLLKAEEVHVEAVRIEPRAGSLVLDENLKVVNKPASEAGGSRNVKPILHWSNLIAPTQKHQSEGKNGKHTGKSIWRGRDGDEVSVEIRALQHYEDQGYKGFHCEGRIVTTLFGLLFWDIIFAQIPGAFETPYQSAPLDLAEDSFYHSRQELADKVLSEIKDGQAARILEEHYDAHAERSTWCVGVRWDLFQKQDLLEIVECLGGSALSTICRLLCEDYAGRTAGVPDLIVWNADSNECRFVEVKGPGDTLQENQKVWIDVLLRAGVAVDVCHVAEHGTGKHVKGKKGKGTKATAGRKRKRADSDQEEVIMESEDEPEELDYSQLDVRGDDTLPVISAPTISPRVARNVAFRTQEVTTPSPTKKRRLRARSDSLA